MRSSEADDLRSLAYARTRPATSSARRRRSRRTRFRGRARSPSLNAKLEVALTDAAGNPSQLTQRLKLKA